MNYVASHRRRDMRHRRVLAWLALAVVLVAPLLYADGPKALDFGADAKQFESLFGRYGYQPTQTIVVEKKGVRFKMPTTAKGIEQTGLYSFFVLAGDFEIVADYEIINLPAPTKGYGASFGIAVEAKDTGAFIALARGHPGGKGKTNEYLVTLGEKEEGKPKYSHPSREATPSKKGRLIIRREKKEIVCLVADKPTEEPRELARVPFSTGTIKQIRLFADTGGSPTDLDARLANLQVTTVTEEITAGTPRSEERIAWGWWLTVLGAILLPFLGYWLYRHQRAPD